MGCQSQREKHTHTHTRTTVTDDMIKGGRKPLIVLSL